MKESINMGELQIKSDERSAALAEQPWWVRIQVYLAAIALSIMITAFAGWAMPFEPFYLYGWKQVPPTVCPGILMNTYYDSEVIGGPYSIGSMEGQATIVKDGRVVSSYPIDEQLHPYPRQIKKSLVQRTAPLTPGIYQLGLDVTVFGGMFGLVPKYQEVDEVSRESFVVLDEDNKQCK